MAVCCLNMALQFGYIQLDGVQILNSQSEIPKSLRGNLTSQCQSLRALQLCLPACCIAGAECDI